VLIELMATGGQGRLRAGAMASVRGLLPRDAAKVRSISSAVAPQCISRTLALTTVSKDLVHATPPPLARPDPKSNGPPDWARARVGRAYPGRAERCLINNHDQPEDTLSGILSSGWSGEMTSIMHMRGLQW
jgi:hypothetical protein